jgi:hypothetical protein
MYSGTVAYNGTNLITDGSCAALFQNQLIGDPMLDPNGLQDNGGVVPTIALLHGSPAVNVGSNSDAVDGDGNPLLYDARGEGFSRIVGDIVDLGAYELVITEGVVNGTLRQEEDSQLLTNVAVEANAEAVDWSDVTCSEMDGSFELRGVPLNTPITLIVGGTTDTCGDNIAWETEIWTATLTQSTYHPDNLDFELLRQDRDLVASQFEAYTDHVLAGQTQVNFTIANVGTSNVDAFTGDLVLSQDEIIGNEDDVTIQTLQLAELAGGASREESVLVQLPVSTLYTWAQSDDSYLLALVLDPADELGESNEGNNFAQGLGIDFDDITYFPWDVDRDGVVTALDAIYVQNRVGQNDPRADLDGDGIVEQSEVEAIQARLGNTVNTAVIEPGYGNTPINPVPVSANIAVRTEIEDGNATPGLQVGETYTLNLYFEDDRVQPAQSVYAGYANVRFDPTLARVDSISYGSGYTVGQRGSIDNTMGWVYSVGATSANSAPNSNTLVVSLQITAIASGNQMIQVRTSSDPFAMIAAYGNDSDQRLSVTFNNIEVFVAPEIDQEVTTVGLYRNGVWMFREENSSGSAQMTFRFGANEDGWIPLTGDWDGDGVDGIGLYKNGLFLLRNSTDSGSPELRYRFGAMEAGWQPIVGDWNGNGIETVGVYKDGLFVLTNSHETQQIAARFRFGSTQSGWTALAGDWNGDGRHGVGLYKDGMFYLTDYFTGDMSIPAFTYGATQASPIIGDWNGDGIETIGTYHNGLWMLRDSNDTGSATTNFSFGSSSTGWLPVANYRGGLEGLSSLGLASEGGEPIAPTPVPTETQEPVSEVTPEVTPEIEPTVVVPEVTSEPTEPMSVAPEVTPQPTEATPVAPETTPEAVNTPETTPPEEPTQQESDESNITPEVLPSETNPDVTSEVDF